MPPHDYEPTPTVDHSAENIKIAVDEWLNDHSEIIELFENEGVPV